MTVLTFRRPRSSQNWSPNCLARSGFHASITSEPRRKPEWRAWWSMRVWRSQNQIAGPNGGLGSEALGRGLRSSCLIPKGPGSFLLMSEDWEFLLGSCWVPSVLTILWFHDEDCSPDSSAQNTDHLSFPWPSGTFHHTRDHSVILSHKYLRGICHPQEGRSETFSPVSSLGCPRIKPFFAANAVVTFRFAVHEANDPASKTQLVWLLVHLLTTAPPPGLCTFPSVNLRLWPVSLTSLISSWF